MTLAALAISALCVAICSAGEGGAPVIACNTKAIRPDERPRYNDLMKRLRGAVRNQSEITDGYTFNLDARGMSLSEVGEWINMERLCCPFLTFQLEVKGGHGDSQLTLRGPSGTKEILRHEFPEHSK